MRCWNMKVKCSWCETEFKPTKAQKGYLRLTGRGYCTKVCSGAYRAKRSSETMRLTNLKYCSERMTRNNPMRRAESREKMKATVLAMGCAPKVRGGNGKPPTVPEVILNMMFCDLGFVQQPIIRTGWGVGLPKFYKPDMGHWGLRISLEADGPSHNTLERQASDARKDAFLIGEGWTVLRFSNRTILEEPMEVWETVTSTISKLKGYTRT